LPPNITINHERLKQWIEAGKALSRGGAVVVWSRIPEGNSAS
jgi:hypothetical protein